MDEDVSRFDLPPTTRRIRSAGRRAERDWLHRRAKPMWPTTPTAPAPVDAQLVAVQSRHAAELIAGREHYAQTMHAQDRRHPHGRLMVRIDDGGPGVPRSMRLYAEVRAGYGEGARVARARAGKR